MLKGIKKLFKRSEEVNAKKDVINIVEPYKVKIDTGLLPVRKGPGAEYDVVGTVKENNVFVIVEEIINKDGEVWGLLKAFRKERNGWINLKYTQKK